MSAPTRSASSAQSSPQVKPPVVLKKVVQRLSVIQWLALAAAAMLVSTALLFLQRPWTHLNSFAPGTRSLLLESIEWNSVRGLPNIIGKINAVAMQPGGSRVWIAGDTGLLAFSDDGGGCWTKLAYDAPTDTFNVVEPQCDKRLRESGFGVSLRVQAATFTQQSLPNRQSGPPAQQTQAPLPNEASKPTAAAPGGTAKLAEVPSLLGMSLGDAETKLASNGLRLGKISQTYSVSEIGKVVFQSTEPGLKVMFGLPIDVTVGEKSQSPDNPQNPKGKVPQNPNDGKAHVNNAPKQDLRKAANLLTPDLLLFDFSGSPASILARDGRTFARSETGGQWTGSAPDKLVMEAGSGSRLVAELKAAYSFIVSLRGAADSGALQTAKTGGFFPIHVSEVMESLAGPTTKSVTSFADGLSTYFTARALWFSRKDSGCVAGYDKEGGQILCTHDGGIKWSSPKLKLSDHLEDMVFASDGNVGWAVGDNGVVLHTGDGGEHWTPKTQSAAKDMGIPLLSGDWWRLLPPWFYAAWVFGLICAAVAPFARIEESPVDFIQDYAANDRPLERGDRDALDFTSLAKALSAFVRNSATKPPLTISIDGAWGSGKSSLMNLMCADLCEFGFHAVWFNAWHNQKEEHLLAALLQTVRADAVPPLWDLSGVGFRCRLVGYRLKRYWFPMLLVSGLAVFLFALDYYHYSSSPDHHSLLVDVPRILPKWLGGTGQEAGGLFAALNHWPSLGTLLGLAALWPVVKKLLQAFGTNPAALLATLSKGNRIADLDEQISFREKFSKEFRDVTRSLGEDHQLVVFIDDLDRCRPENVRDVLEAVNFLVTSGECFVVMGLERRSVVAAVGLSLKDIAAEMAGKSEKDDAELIQSRREYASHFLDKLINLEVPIPRLDPDKARGLFYDDGPRKASDDAKVAAELRRRARAARAGQYARFADGAARFLFALLLTGALGWRAYKGGEWLNDQAKAQVVAHSQSGSASKPAQTVSGRAVGPPTQGAGQKEQDKTNLAPPTSSGPPPEIKPGSSPRPDPWKLSWPELAAIALLAAIAYSTLVGTGRGARHDSPKFIESLEIWYPLVIERQGTPRAVKRWMNRVRYLATREMPASELRSPFERFADWYVARIQSKDAPPEGAVAGGPEKQPEKIPEEIVVALAAIHEFDSGILTGASHFDFLQNVGKTSGISSLGKGSADQLISRQRALHVEKLGQESWEQIVKFAPRFLNLWPTIDIH